MDPLDSDIRTVLVTAPDADAGADSEAVLIIKTAVDRCEELASRIQELHPYDLPEVLVLSAAGGSAPYLEWVEAETRP